jgi:hypothetical protein
MLTYYDATDQKLPLLKHDYNLENPDTWNIVSSGYNDSINLSAPYPQIVINKTLHQAVLAWIACYEFCNGVAMSDAEYRTWPGIPELIDTTNLFFSKVYPNPSSDRITLVFELKKPDKVIIKLQSILGQLWCILTDQSFDAGKHSLVYNMSDYSCGMYLISVLSNGFTATKKLSVIK